MCTAVLMPWVCLTVFLAQLAPCLPQPLSSSDSSSWTSIQTSTTIWYLFWQSWNQKVSSLLRLHLCSSPAVDHVTALVGIYQTCHFYVTTSVTGLFGRDSSDHWWHACRKWCGTQNMGHSNFKPISWHPSTLGSMVHSRWPVALRHFMPQCLEAWAAKIKIL